MTSVRIQHQVQKRGGKIRTRKFSSGGYNHYRIRVFLAGDLDDVDFVEYELHPSFPDPVRIAKSRDNDFAIDIWTWGEFEIFAVVHTTDGDKIELTYDLAYSDQLPDIDSQYVDETPARQR